MQTLSIDIETYSDVNLSKCGVYKYAESPDFEILLFGYSSDGSEVTVIDLAQGERLPQEIIDALTDDTVIKWAFNANFERVCLSRYLRDLGVSLDPFHDNHPLSTECARFLNPESWRCSMVWAATMGLPLSLEGVGAVLGLEKQKLTEGKDLIKYFSVPCAPTKTNGGRTRNHPFHAPDKWEAFKKYNIRDVETEIGIKDRLAKFPVPEEVWDEYESLSFVSREDSPRARRPVGRSKSLRPFSPENGAGSFTQKLQFKQGIKPCTTEMEVIDMAKDGTYRGGRRVKAGSKPDALADKIMKGAPAKRMELPDFTEDMTDFDVDDIGDGVELEGMDMPSPDDYLSALQKDGKPLGADEIYKETWLWLKERGCERLVNKRLLESYSEAFARYIQCSEAVSKYGMLGKHPTTGAAIASPFTQLLMNFQKQANLLWYEIYDIVKQNCTEPFEGSPQDSVMEQLLRSRRNM